MLQPHPAALPIDRLLTECEVVRTRRSGPGGQHRNKVETAVVILHRPTQIRGEASERRSQAQNKAVAAFRLRLNLALGLRLPREPTDSPGELWQSRCHAGRIAVSMSHDDFPALLAEALDVVAANQSDLKQAASVLGCTPTQLLRFLQQEPHAMANVNRDRESRGLHRLK